MKKLLLFLVLCAITVWSCKKSNSSKNSGSGYYLSAAVNVTDKASLVDSMIYDSSHRLSAFLQIKYDTSTGVPLQTSTSILFTLPGGSAPATAYTYQSPNSYELHSLSYDNQGRIIKDTCAATGYVATFTYPANAIAIRVLYDGTPMNNQIDTLFMSGGNIAKANTWMPNDAGTADSLQGSLNFGYSSVTNPFYHPSISASVGPLLYVFTVNGLGGGLDPVSAKTQSSISGKIDGLPSNLTIPFTQTLDNKGRLSELSASVFGFGGEAIYFRYY
jgi:hypothetical protein